jgi:hypothetical protein
MPSDLKKLLGHSEPVREDFPMPGEGNVFFGSGIWGPHKDLTFGRQDPNTGLWKPGKGRRHAAKACGCHGSDPKFVVEEGSRNYCEKCARAGKERKLSAIRKEELPKVAEEKAASHGGQPIANQKLTRAEKRRLKFANA